MQSFGTVLKFEINHYLKNKVFLITTVILILLLTVGLSIPTIIEAFEDEEDTTEVSDDQMTYYGIYDPSGYVDDLAFLQANYYPGTLKSYDDIDLLKEDVISGELEGGYNINSDLSYDYVVLNNQMSDRAQHAFNNAFTSLYQKTAFESRGLNFEEVQVLIYPNMMGNVEILGKDSVSNYAYTYILVFGLYFMIIMYGQLIATAVASEKSNRTMELLVTSTKTSYLIFGKVLGGAIAGFIQFAIVLGLGKVSYSLNSDAWDGFLDFVFDIPGDILLQFSIFGLLGYLLFAFIFGALGALVSKTEDVNASATPVTLIFVAVFMISVIGMQDTDGMLLKIASYVPLSSFMAMFVRVSMGSVAIYEVIISLSILVATTILIGWFSSKIYRAGTLMYGNPVKMKDIPKIMKSQ